MKGQKRNRHLKRYIIIFSLLLISFILYRLADRYLIEHVQVSQAFPSDTTTAVDSNIYRSQTSVLSPTVSPPFNDSVSEITVTPPAVSITSVPTMQITPELVPAKAVATNKTKKEKASKSRASSTKASPGKTPAKAKPSATVSPMVDTPDTSTNEAPAEATPTVTQAPSIVSPFIDDWNYISEAITVKIKKVTEGSGNDTITYFVADVQLKTSDSLKAAFAKNAFGTNIVQDTSIIASDNNAIFAINGDYYGFRNDGIIIRNGKSFRDKPARPGFAVYNDGTMKNYDETSTTAQDLLDAGVVQTFSFGPLLVSNGEAVPYFGKTIIDTNFGNYQIEGKNPRTGIGYIAPNHFVFVVVDGRSNGYSRGMTLVEFAALFQQLGCKEAYNLDGGGSSTMYFMGRVVNNPLGKGKERGVSDIIYIN